MWAERGPSQEVIDTQRGQRWAVSAMAWQEGRQGRRLPHAGGCRRRPLYAGWACWALASNALARGARAPPRQRRPGARTAAPPRWALGRWAARQGAGPGGRLPPRPPPLWASPRWRPWPPPAAGSSAPPRTPRSCRPPAAVGRRGGGEGGRGQCRETGGCRARRPHTSPALRSLHAHPPDLHTPAAPVTAQRSPRPGPHLPVLEPLDRHAALGAGRHLAHVVLDAAQAEQLALRRRGGGWRVGWGGGGEGSAEGAVGKRRCGQRRPAGSAGICWRLPGCARPARRLPAGLRTSQPAPAEPCQAPHLVHHALAALDHRHRVAAQAAVEHGAARHLAPAAAKHGLDLGGPDRHALLDCRRRRQGARRRVTIGLAQGTTSLARCAAAARWPANLHFCFATAPAVVKARTRLEPALHGRAHVVHQVVDHGVGAQLHAARLGRRLRDGQDAGVGSMGVCC